MTDPLIEEDDGSTPLAEEEREQLIPSYITLKRELNEAEQANILDAESWVFNRKRDVLNERFLTDLHNRMFGRVWCWAGSYRRSQKNVGIDAYRIPVDLRQLIEDCHYWIEHETCSPDEIATRFHHSLAAIHPFPNGNGRHARLATDLLLTKLGQERFSWGQVNLVDASETRDTYINALRAANKHDYGPLLAFVRS